MPRGIHTPRPRGAPVQRPPAILSLPRPSAGTFSSRRLTRAGRPPLTWKRRTRGASFSSGATSPQSLFPLPPPPPPCHPLPLFPTSPHRHPPPNRPPQRPRPPLLCPLLGQLPIQSRLHPRSPPTPLPCPPSRRSPPHRPRLCCRRPLPPRPKAALLQLTNTDASFRLADKSHSARLLRSPLNSWHSADDVVRSLVDAATR